MEDLTESYSAAVWFEEKRYRFFGYCSRRFI